MPDYQKCMMYKLICDEDQNFLYVGNTTNWNRRKSEHKSSSLNDTRKAYTRIRELGGWGDMKMIWIEDYPCNNKREAEAREQHWMDILKSNMNTHRAFITEEYKKEYQKEHYENNKEEIREKNKEYREANKETIAENREANKEAFAERMKEYREANKEAISNRKNVKYDCECGGKYTHVNQAKHFRSKLHQDWLLTCHTAEVQVG